MKLDAATGAVIWEFEMPTNNSDGLSSNDGYKVGLKTWLN